MEYRIEYANGKCCNFAHSRVDLIDWLKILKDETISDVRKLYKSGISDSVMEKYKKYMGGGNGGTYGRASMEGAWPASGGEGVPAGDRRILCGAAGEADMQD